MTTCGLQYEKGDSPWVYRCVLDKGHSGECDPQLVPPPPRVAPADVTVQATALATSPAYRVAEQVFLIAMKHAGRPWTWDRVSITQKAEWCREVEAAGLTGAGALLDTLDRLQEEVGNLSSEGLLRMGLHDSPVRYHAHGEVLWPVGPRGMCQGCE